MKSRIHRKVYVRFGREYGTIEIDGRPCLPHDLDIQVSKLKLLKANHTSQIYRLEDDIAKRYPQQMKAVQEKIDAYHIDIERYVKNKPKNKDEFHIKIGNRMYTDKKEAGTALLEMCRSAKQPNTYVEIGEFQGFKMSVLFDSFSTKFFVSLKGELSHKTELGIDILGNIQRLTNTLEGMATNKLPEQEQMLLHLKQQLENAQKEVAKPFAQEEELKTKMERLNQLNALLNMDEKGEDAVLCEDVSTIEEEAEEIQKPESFAQKLAEKKMEQRKNRFTKDNLKNNEKRNQFEM